MSGIPQTFDVAVLVDKLMLYQSLNLNRMQGSRQVEKTQVSAYEGVQQLVTAFQTAMTNLQTLFNAPEQVTASNASVIGSASLASTNKLTAGTHAVVVSSLASAQQTGSNTQFTTTGALNLNETLTFTNAKNPTNNFNVQINSTDTLQDICNNINGATGNIGLTASIVTANTADGPVYNLVLTSQNGTANQFTISGDASGTAGFQFNNITNGSDAIFTFDGYAQVSGSNTISNIMPGLNFTLSGLGQATLTIAPTVANATDIQNTVTAMLTAYNNLVSFLDGNQQVTLYDDKNNKFCSANNTAFSFIKTQLQSVTTANFTVNGDISNLFEAGIITGAPSNVVDKYDPRKVVQTTGNLILNPTGSVTLGNILNTDLASLQHFFTDPNGFINSMNNVINKNIVGTTTNGLITTALATLQTQDTAIDSKIKKETARLVAVRADLVDTYSRLNGMLAKYQSMSDFLDKQFDYLADLVKGK